jgi:hypothetical protein
VFNILLLPVVVVGAALTTEAVAEVLEVIALHVKTILFLAAEALLSLFLH